MSFFIFVSRKMRNRRSWQMRWNGSSRRSDSIGSSGNTHSFYYLLITHSFERTHSFISTIHWFLVIALTSSVLFCVDSNPDSHIDSSCVRNHSFWWFFFVFWQNSQSFFIYVIFLGEFLATTILSNSNTYSSCFFIAGIFSLQLHK